MSAEQEQDDDHDEDETLAEWLELDPSRRRHPVIFADWHNEPYSPEEGGVEEITLCEPDRDGRTAIVYHTHTHSLLYSSVDYDQGLAVLGRGRVAMLRDDPGRLAGLLQRVASAFLDQWSVPWTTSDEFCGRDDRRAWDPVTDGDARRLAATASWLDMEYGGAHYTQCIVDEKGEKGRWGREPKADDMVHFWMFPDVVRAIIDMDYLDDD